MASRKENLKSLFSNTRTRVIIIFTAALLLVGIVVGFIKFSSGTKSAEDASANLGSAPGGIQSIPGGLDPTQQYAALVAKSNKDQADEATKSGGSAIPTIIRSQAFGGDVQSVGPTGGQGGLGFSGLSQESSSGDLKSQWVATLQNNNCDKSTINQVVGDGATLEDLKQGCSCKQLKEHGYGLSQLKQVCDCTDLKKLGFNAKEFKQANYTASQLKSCSFGACALREAGFDAEQLKNAGFTNGELRGAGFSDAQIAQASGLPPGVTAQDVKNAGCSESALMKLKNSGVTAAAIRRISGCTATQLKAAGFNAADLKAAGFSAAQLKDAGFSAEALKSGGYSARDLLNAGFSPADLDKAGFTPKEIKAAESQLPPGFDEQDIRNAGCSKTALEREREAGVSALLARKYAHCSLEQLRSAGFTPNDLANAGFSPEQIGSGSQVSDSAIRGVGCNVAKLKVLRKEGVSAKRIRDLNNCTAADLKAAGFDAKQLANAGFSPDALLGAGFTPQQLMQAGLTPSTVSDADIKSAGCSANGLEKLRSEGVNAARIRKLNNCTASEFKAAGFSAKQLANAGFSPAALLGAGFTPQQLMQAGLTPSAAIVDGRETNCTVASLETAKKMGVSATTIEQTLGCSANAMKSAGYTASELKAAGFTAAELKNAGFDAKQLKAAGFDAKQLADAGFDAEQLKNAGFDAEQLMDAGFSKTALKNAGFSVPSQASAEQSSDSAVASLSSPPPASDYTASIPSISGKTDDSKTSQSQHDRLRSIMNQQQKAITEQRYHQKIQQRTSEMLSAANVALQSWKTIPDQAYVAGKETKKDSLDQQSSDALSRANREKESSDNFNSNQKAIIKTGDILFAVLDTSVNSDEPGPILATIVSGPLKGSKLIGSFNLASNADKMTIQFTTMTVPGANQSTSINAYAIDPNTARTALSSRVDHHYLYRYGSLFASKFLEGFGNAFQSANTSVTVGGTGGVSSTTVQNGINRSILENAVIGLATLGKSWGEVARQNMDRPTTVDVYSGTGLGVLFMQDVTSI